MLLSMSMALQVALAPAMLAPTGKWLVQAEPDYCLLARQYGAAPGMTLGLQPIYDGEQAELILIVPENKASDRVGRAVVRFDEDAAADAFYWSYATKDANTRLVRIVVDTAQTRRLGTARTLTVAVNGETRRFVLTGGGAALRALDACQDQLAADLKIKGDGLPPEMVQANWQRYFNPGLYPDIARDQRLEGVVVSDLLIGVDGRVKGCRVTETPAVVLARQTCAIVQQYARLKPAKDSDGKPRPSTYRLRVRWQLS